MIAIRDHLQEATMSNFQSRSSGPAQAARPSAAAAKVDDERYRTFQSRMTRLAEAASNAGRTALANQLVDLSQRVEDREITLDEGLAELRDHEPEIRSMLKR
jgi:phage shock protein A